MEVFYESTNPLFSLDEIGVELQNPFSPRNLSHLPLPGICRTIELNVLSLEKDGGDRKRENTLKVSRPMVLDSRATSSLEKA